MIKIILTFENATFVLFELLPSKENSLLPEGSGTVPEQAVHPLDRPYLLNGNMNPITMIPSESL